VVKAVVAHVATSYFASSPRLAYPFRWPGASSKEILVSQNISEHVGVSDDELLRAIAENTDGMSALVRDQVELEAGSGEWDDPEIRNALMRSNAQQIGKLQRQYHHFAEELRRRYP
jgi:hypothetical protein